MIPVKVISRVEIPVITEAVISELIEKEILSHNPNVEIASIIFERKLNPQRMEVLVEATLKGAVAVDITEAEPTKTENTSGEVAQAEASPFKTDEPKTVGGMFNLGA
jgi:hypothetical protein